MCSPCLQTPAQPVQGLRFSGWRQLFFSPFLPLNGTSCNSPRGRATLPACQPILSAPFVLQQNSSKSRGGQGASKPPPCPALQQLGEHRRDARTPPPRHPEPLLGHFCRLWLSRGGGCWHLSTCAKQQGEEKPKSCPAKVWCQLDQAFSLQQILPAVLRKGFWGGWRGRLAGKTAPRWWWWWGVCPWLRQG